MLFFRIQMHPAGHNYSINYYKQKREKEKEKTELSTLLRTRLMESINTSDVGARNHKLQRKKNALDFDAISSNRKREIPLPVSFFRSFVRDQFRNPW